MECTQARRFFLVCVIRHDVVEINLEARDVLFHGTSGFASTRRESMLCASKNEANFAVRIHGAPGTELLSSKRKMGLSEQTKERLTCESLMIAKLSRMEYLTELNALNRNDKFLLAHQLTWLKCYDTK